MTLICENVQTSELKRLAAAVITQAVQDAQKARLEKQLEAVWWLASEDMANWLDWAGLQTDNALDLLTSGKLRKARTGKRKNGRSERGK